MALHIRIPMRRSSESLLLCRRRRPLSVRSFCGGCDGHENGSTSGQDNFLTSRATAWERTSSSKKEKRERKRPLFQTDQLRLGKLSTGKYLRQQSRIPASGGSGRAGLPYGFWAVRVR